MTELRGRSNARPLPPCGRCGLVADDVQDMIDRCHFCAARAAVLLDPDADVPEEPTEQFPTWGPAR